MVPFRDRLSLPRPRVRLRVLAVVLSALLLLCVSALTSFCLFGVRHVFSTPHEQKFPVFFAADRSIPGLSANVSLNPERLRYASSLRAQLRLVLPDSDVNLASSVFSVSAQLQLVRLPPAGGAGPPGSATDVAVGGAQVVLRFRSSAHRAVRAVALALPLVIGLADEYQRVRIDVLRHDLCAAGCAAVPANNVHITLHAPVQVARAELVLYTTRRTFITSLVRDYAGVFLVVTVLLWYSLLAAVAFAFWTGTKFWAALGKVWSKAWGERERAGRTLAKTGSVSGTKGATSVEGREVCETRWCSEDMVSGDLPPLFGGVRHKSFSYQRSMSRVSENGTPFEANRRSGLRRRVSLESSSFSAKSSSLLT